jgi:hypothetical protein
MPCSFEFKKHHFFTCALHKNAEQKHQKAQKPYITFAMRHWEKNQKKELRRSDDRDFRQHDQESKKKKLKPVEKSKYRVKGYFEEEE